MLEVYKFGGSVVTDATALKKIAHIILGSPRTKFIVLSATYNTTNRLEQIHHLFASGDALYLEELHLLLRDHLLISKELNLDIDQQLEELFISGIKKSNVDELSFKQSLDYFYSLGELASSFILASYLQEIDSKYSFLDIRDYLVTNNVSNEASPMLYATKENISELSKEKSYITQGFIGRSKEGFVCTLGREGSDFTGAILAWCVGAESLTIWKDVDGIFNCDPGKYKKSRIIRNISYRDASLLTEKGAKVLFNRTMEPLEKNDIQLYVRSVFSKDPGTVISNKSDTFFSITAQENGDLYSKVSIIFDQSSHLAKYITVLDSFSSLYEQGPTFVTYLIDKDSEANLIEELLEALDRFECI